MEKPLLLGAPGGTQIRDISDHVLSTLTTPTTQDTSLYSILVGGVIRVYSNLLCIIIKQLYEFREHHETYFMEP